ncbi:hypothetical protein BBO_07126 [Beauveria brongniartii RCEF 3172]|uniref:Uncharacterized protein n=1 Tax=Beauveria brongniartii RCEF 3172 TaxID=1081107 RepID=A0A162J2B5_9HYPO|nr:hypothetical protein BBO_07126 [Beauveria brongniartii RCEF 3172]
MSVKSPEVNDGNARRKLLRKYDGDLDRRLQYREGSLIHTHYPLYKQADDDFDAGTKAYRTAALELAILIKIAFAGATAAIFTANLRKEFNQAYGDVLTMKHQLHGHMRREKGLRCRAQRYLSLRRQHAAASDETLRKTVRGEAHPRVAIYPVQI